MENKDLTQKESEEKKNMLACIADILKALIGIVDVISESKK